MIMWVRIFIYPNIVPANYLGLASACYQGSPLSHIFITPAQRISHHTTQTTRRQGVELTRRKEHGVELTRALLTNHKNQTEEPTQTFLSSTTAH